MNENPVDKLIEITKSKNMRDLAGLFGVHYETVRLWKKRGEIPLGKVNVVVEKLSEVGISIAKGSLNSQFNT